MIGRPATDFVQFGEREAANEALRALSTGAINVYIAHRELHAPTGSAPMATQWLRAFEVGDRRLALAQAAPATDDDLSPIAKHFGRDSTKMAIGTIDRDFTITAISRDITLMLGLSPQDFIGLRLLAAVARRDVSALLDALNRVADKTIGLTIHLRNRDERWVDLCCLLTPLDGNPDRCFIIAPHPDVSAERSRVSDLEQHLWQIAGIVEASGVLRGFGPMRDMTALPQVNDLTSRQWEVLARIVRGERVPTIAADLRLSQSTVWNHLSVMAWRDQSAAELSTSTLESAAHDTHLLLLSPLTRSSATADGDRRLWRVEGDGGCLSPRRPAVGQACSISGDGTG